VSWSILVVEDDIDVREALVDVLQARGYQVFSAPNGMEALDRIHREGLRPAVIILDLMMPMMSGGEFLEHLANDPWRSGVPVVVVTAQPRRSREIPVAVAAVLHKPLPLAHLLETIRSLCSELPQVH
jgi:two-component system, chemotaxis family, chemotaxis protein CheY